MSDAEDGEPEKDTSGQAWEREKHQAQLDAFQALVGELTTQREENGRTERIKRLLEVVTIVMVFLTLCATGFGDWVFFKTMKEARAAATKAHDDNVAALTNARTAAYIQHWETGQALARADTANGISRSTASRQLRAYVYVKPGPLGVLDFSVGKAPHTTIVIRNSGQTPAYNMKMRGNIGVNAWPIAKNKPFREGPYGADMVLNPETEDATGGNVSVKDGLAEREVEAIGDGLRYRLYVFGSVVYDDVFGAHHRTDYCFAYFGQGPTLMGMEFCNRHGRQY